MQPTHSALYRGLHSLWHDEEASLVEFAIVAPVFLYFFLGILELSMVWYSNNLLANQFFRFVYGAHVGCIDAQDTTGACDANHQTSGALLRQRLQQNLFFSRLCAGSFTITASRLSNTLGWQPIFTTGSGGELMHYQVTYTYQRFFVPQMLDDIFPGIFRLGHDMMIRNASFPATDGVGNPLGNYPLTTGC